MVEKWQNTERRPCHLGRWREGRWLLERWPTLMWKPVLSERPHCNKENRNRKKDKKKGGGRMKKKERGQGQQRLQHEHQWILVIKEYYLQTNAPGSSDRNKKWIGWELFNFRTLQPHFLLPPFKESRSGIRRALPQTSTCLINHATQSFPARSLEFPLRTAVVVHSVACSTIVNLNKNGESGLIQHVVCVLTGETDNATGKLLIS